MQLHLQAVRIYQVDAKARSGDMTSKHNITLADQRSGKKKRETQKRHIIKKKRLQNSSSGGASGSPYVSTDGEVD